MGNGIDFKTLKFLPAIMIVRRAFIFIYGYIIQIQYFTCINIGSL